MSNIDRSYKVSNNFLLGEFAVSSSYPELAKKIVFSNENALTIQLLCIQLLQPIRNHFGPIEILSGKRSKALNTAIGGASTSDHMTSNAADIRPLKAGTETVFKWAIENKMPYRQIIWYPDQDFIHVACNIPSKPFKNQAMVHTQVHGRYRYVPADVFYQK